MSFFEDQSLITPDTDTNSLGYSLLLESDLTTPEEANKILNSILEYTDENGKIQVWLSKERENRLDHVVVTNAVYLAYLLGRENEVESTEEWLTKLLESEKYLEGSRYYHSPDSFLYFLGRLMKFPEAEKKLKAKLKEQLQKRIGNTNDSLDLAMRIVLADMLGVSNEKERQALLGIQEQNGSWPTDALYREGTKPRYFVNQSLPTSLAMRALSKK